MPTLPFDPVTGQLVVKEGCGLDHEGQVVELGVPPGLSREVELFSFCDVESGAAFPAQRSRQNPDVAFVRLELSAGQEYRLEARKQAVPERDAVETVALSREGNGRAVVSNGKWAAELFVGEWRASEEDPTSLPAPTPIRRLRVKSGSWRGNSFFDTRQPVRHVSGTVLESGPLRIVVHFQADVGASHSYSARITCDAGADFIVVDEVFEGDSDDQMVWDFSGKDLPDQILLLDSSAAFTTRPLHYLFDHRLARLACWNQFSQLHDFSDGYALTFPASRDVIGWVALKGGDWNGNSHNFLEAWSRRWLPGDPFSRRLPFETKADAAPSPEKIAARPVNICEPHFSLEGWLHRGRRIFALVLTSKDSLRPSDWNNASPLGPFETKPDRARYRQQQSLLRRIHTHHGLFPLADQLASCWAWPAEAPSPSAGQPEPPWVRDESNPEALVSIPARVEETLEFLAARVFGFWEGSGAAYTNPVVSRPLAHQVAEWEWLAAHGHLTAAQSDQIRVWLVFLCHLFHSDHYYPGAASMNLGAPEKRLEPSIAGMANQNFFTDVFNLPGMAAQVFHSHPEAAAWRERFGSMWRRQLEYHVYPESGVWEESHTYFHHVLQTVLPTLERRRDDGVEDGFSDPAFQRLASSLLRTLSPRDACFDGKRHVVPMGDHGVDLDDLYRPLTGASLSIFPARTRNWPLSWHGLTVK